MEITQCGHFSCVTENKKNDCLIIVMGFDDTCVEYLMSFSHDIKLCVNDRKHVTCSFDGNIFSFVYVHTESDVV